MIMYLLVSCSEPPPGRIKPKLVGGLNPWSYNDIIALVFAQKTGSEGFRLDTDKNRCRHWLESIDPSVRRVFLVQSMSCKAKGLCTSSFSPNFTVVFRLPCERGRTRIDQTPRSLVVGLYA